MKKKDGNDGSKKSPEEPAKEKKKEPEPAKDVEPNRPKESGLVVAEATLTGGTSLGGSNGGGNNNSNNNNNNNNNDNDDDHSNNMSSVVSYQAGSYPPLLAIAMKDKPPLPGRPFSINISDPAVKKTIIEICDRREPHFVLFHMKDPEEPDTDIINNRDSVYTIGVHCYVQRYYEDGPYLRILGLSLIHI